MPLPRCAGCLLPPQNQNLYNGIYQLDFGFFIWDLEFVSWNLFKPDYLKY